MYMLKETPEPYMYLLFTSELHIFITHYSLSEYADIYGKIPENRLWSIILDLSQVSAMYIYVRIHDNFKIRLY